MREKINNELLHFPAEQLAIVDSKTTTIPPERMYERKSYCSVIFLIVPFGLTVTFQNLNFEIWNWTIT